MKKPTKSEIELLVKRCAGNLWAAEHNADIKTQTRLYDAYMKTLAKLQVKYPHIDFDTGIENHARKWINEHIMGPGTTY